MTVLNVSFMLQNLSLWRRLFVFLLNLYQYSVKYLTVRVIYLQIWSMSPLTINLWWSVGFSTAMNNICFQQPWQFMKEHQNYIDFNDYVSDTYNREM